MPELQPPALRQRERVEQRVEHGDVAEAKREVFQPGAAHRLDREQHDLDIGALSVAVAEAFDAGLAKLARVGAVVGFRLKAERGAVIAIAGFVATIGVTLEIKPRHRHGQVGPQAQLIARKVGEDVSAAPDLLADAVEKDVRRLEDRRRNLLVACAPERVEQGRGLGFESLEFFGQFGSHGSGLVTGKHGPNGLDEFVFRYEELRFGLLLQVLVAILDPAERGAEDEVLDLHGALGLLVAALDDDARGATPVGVFHLCLQAALAEIKLGADAGAPQLLHHGLIVGDAVAIEHEHDDRASAGTLLNLPRRWRPKRSRETPMETPVAGTFSPVKRSISPS